MPVAFLVVMTVLVPQKLFHTNALQSACIALTTAIVLYHNYFCKSLYQKSTVRRHCTCQSTAKCARKGTASVSAAAICDVSAGW